MPRYKPIPERIADLSVAEPNSGCWLWIGSVDKCGYGKSSVGSETLAHRISYRFYIGAIPAGTEIDHICNNRCCVNPAHLRAVTHAENVSRAIHPYETHRNGRKSHCGRGHPFNAENTITEVWLGKPRRKCRVCTNDGQARRKAKRTMLRAA